MSHRLPIRNDFLKGKRKKMSHMQYQKRPNKGRKEGEITKDECKKRPRKGRRREGHKEWL